MSKQASPTLIGAFVIGAIALALAALIILGGGKLFTRQLPVVMFFEGSSLAGLSPGAPITFRGVRLGQVTEVFLRYNFSEQTIRIPVFGVIDASQIRWVGELPPDVPKGSGLKQLINRGLRAQLGVLSLVTGQMAINLDFYATPASNADANENPYGDRVEIPTEPSTMEAVQETLQTVIQKISRLPLDQILVDINESISSVATVINNPQLAEVVPNLNATLVNVKHLSETLDQKLGPVIERAEASAPLVDETLVQARGGLAEMQRAFAALERAATRAEQTMASANGLVQPNSPVLFDMSSALREVTGAARSMRNLTDTIARDPNSLLFGRTQPGGAR